MIVLAILVHLVFSTVPLNAAVREEFDQNSERMVDNDNYCSPSNWTILPHPNDCRKFYACINFKMETLNCAEYYYFDEDELNCKPGICDMNAINRPSRKCDPHKPLQRVEGDCTMYNVCMNGNHALSHCNMGQYFDSSLGKCQPILDNAQYKCSCILPEFTVLTNPSNCHTYLMCMGGQAIEQECPWLQYYNETVNSCLPDVEGTCIKAPTPPPQTIDALDTSIYNATNDTALYHIHFHPHPFDCTQFYVCFMGNAFSKHCKRGLYFDPALQYCRSGPANMCRIGQHQTKLLASSAPVSAEENVNEDVDVNVGVEELQDESGVPKPGRKPSAEVAEYMDEESTDEVKLPKKKLIQKQNETENSTVPPKTLKKKKKKPLSMANDSNDKLSSKFLGNQQS